MIKRLSDPRSSRPDLVHGSIMRTLVTFAVPMLIGNLVQTLNGAINTIWVGRLLGESALAATANANVVTFLMFSAVFGLGNATLIRVAGFIGARDVDAARRAFGGALSFSAALTAVVAAIGWRYSPWLLQVLGTPVGSMTQALAYLRLVFVTMPIGTIFTVLGMALRGMGDAKTPLHAMVLVVALDIVLNPLLILGFNAVPALGIAGSALASGIAYGGGVLFIFVQLYRGDLPLRLRTHEFSYLIPSFGDLAYLIGKGIPMSAQMLLTSSSQIVVVGLANREGLDVTAAYGVSIQLWNYLQIPALAISSAVTAMAAQNIGAGQHERVGVITKVGMLISLASTSILLALIVLASRPLLALFLGDASPALPVAQHIQYLVSWSYLVMAVMMVVSGTLRAYGVVVAPLIAQLVALYPARFGFYSAAYPQIGVDGLWLSFPAGTLVSATLIGLIYARIRCRPHAGTSLPQ